MSPATAALLILSLAVASVDAQEPPHRSVAVIAEFGGATDDPADELLRVRTALRLPDGRFVVANGKPLEARVYRPSGELVARLGREGEGPGEYRSAIRVRPWRGDSVRLYSAGTGQWLLYRLDGTFVRQWEISRAEYSEVDGWVLVGSAMVRRGVVGSAGCSTELVRRLAPAKETQLHEAMTDNLGRVWLRPYGATHWTIHAPSGSPIVRLDLPPNFRAMQFEGDILVGVRVDDDGFEHVMALRHDLPPVQETSTPDCVNAPSGVEPIRAAQIKTAMRNAMTVAEAHYARHREYPPDADAYPGGVKPHGTDFTVLQAGPDSFALSIRDSETGYRCLVSVGSTTEFDGVLLCGK